MRTLLFALIALSPAASAEHSPEAPESGRYVLTTEEDAALTRKQENALVLGKVGSPKLKMTAFPKRLGKGKITSLSGRVQLQWRTQTTFGAFVCNLYHYPKSQTERLFPAGPHIVTNQQASQSMAPGIPTLRSFRSHLKLNFEGGDLWCTKFGPGPRDITLGELQSLFRWTFGPALQFEIVR